MRADPKSAKKNTDDFVWIFTLLGSARIKAVRKQVDEIGPLVVIFWKPQQTRKYFNASISYLIILIRKTVT